VGARFALVAYVPVAGGHSGKLATRLRQRRLDKW